LQKSLACDCVAKGNLFEAVCIVRKFLVDNALSDVNMRENQEASEGTRDSSSGGGGASDDQDVDNNSRQTIICVVCQGVCHTAHRNALVCCSNETHPHIMHGSCFADVVLGGMDCPSCRKPVVATHIQFSSLNLKNEFIDEFVVPMPRLLKPMKKDPKKQKLCNGVKNNEDAATTSTS
jgi:hypothetical protein